MWRNKEKLIHHNILQIIFHYKLNIPQNINTYMFVTV